MMKTVVHLTDCKIFISSIFLGEKREIDLDRDLFLYPAEMLWFYSSAVWPVQKATAQQMDESK